ncbi:MAG: N-acetyltransferase [Candidatus Woesebacteria bacterium]|nr:MAG: N-acetyltransferase [Candidatus Woesebacteria bacterium]
MEHIVFNETINGEEIVVRYPKSGDAGVMCEYINTLSKEKTYIMMQGEQMTITDEEKYLKGQLEKIGKKETVQLLLFVDGKIAGVTAIDLKNRIKSHIGVFGISLAKEYRGKGLGKLLMKLVLDEAKKLSKLKIVTLEVFAENEKAQNMYKSFGFVQYGMLPGGNLYKGKMVDDIQMYKNV